MYRVVWSSLLFSLSRFFSSTIYIIQDSGKDWVMGLVQMYKIYGMSACNAQLPIIKVGYSGATSTGLEVSVRGGAYESPTSHAEIYVILLTLKPRCGIIFSALSRFIVTAFSLPAMLVSHWARRTALKYHYQRTFRQIASALTVHAKKRRNRR